LWRSRWAKKWCWQRDHDILFITFFLGQGNVATWASRPPLGRSPWVVVIKNLKYGFDYYSLKVMSSWALLPLRGFFIHFENPQVCTSKPTIFSIDCFEDTSCHKHMDWLSGFLVFKLTGIIILAWDDAIQGMLHSSIHYLLTWE
jgi:hypothetical protein